MWLLELLLRSDPEGIRASPQLLMSAPCIHVVLRQGLAALPRLASNFWGQVILLPQPPGKLGLPLCLSPSHLGLEVQPGTGVLATCRTFSSFRPGVLVLKGALSCTACSWILLLKPWLRPRPRVPFCRLSVACGWTGSVRGCLVSCGPPAPSASQPLFQTSGLSAHFGGHSRGSSLPWLLTGLWEPLPRKGVTFQQDGRLLPPAPLAVGAGHRAHTPWQPHEECCDFALNSHKTLRRSAREGSMVGQSGHLVWAHLGSPGLIAAWGACAP